MQQVRFQNSAKLNDNIKVGTHDATSPCDWSLRLVASCTDLNASISEKNQLCTRIVNHNNMNNKVFNDVITMKKAFPMLCAHSPSVHSYHFYIWHVSFDHWAFLYEYLLDVP